MRSLVSGGLFLEILNFSMSKYIFNIKKTSGDEYEHSAKPAARVVKVCFTHGCLLPLVPADSQECAGGQGQESRQTKQIILFTVVSNNLLFTQTHS